jgi:hypothetical protein
MGETQKCLNEFFDRFEDVEQVIWDHGNVLVAYTDAPREIQYGTAVIAYAVLDLINEWKWWWSPKSSLILVLPRATTEN